EPAAWPQTNRRWHVAVGALALAASTAMFLLTRSTEHANAAAPAPHGADVDRVSASSALAPALDPAPAPDDIASDVPAEITDEVPASVHEAAPAKLQPA